MTNDDISIKDKVRIVMSESIIPLHSSDVDERIISKFNTKHTSYIHLKSSSEYISLVPSVYIHKNHATEEFYIKYNKLNNKISSDIIKIIDYVKLPIPLSCLIYYFSEINGNDLFTKKSIRSILLNIISNSQTLYKTSNLEVLSMKIIYKDTQKISEQFKRFCKSCFSEKISIHCNEISKCKLSKLNKNSVLKIDESENILEKRSAEEKIEKIEKNNTKNAEDSCNKHDDSNHCEKNESKEEKLSAKESELFYSQIINSTNPEYLISEKLYKSLKKSIECSPYCDQLLTVLASEINLSWPTVRHTEKLSDYLNLDLKSIKKIPTFGRKKSRQLILCIAHAAFKANKYVFLNKISDTDESENYKTYDELLLCDAPYYGICDEIWVKWCSDLKNSPLRFTRIAEISSKYDLEWPYTKRDETISNFISYSFQELLKLQGYGPKKIKTIILSVASSVLKPTTSGIKISQELDKNKPSVIFFVEDINFLIKNELIRLSDREQLVANRRYGLGEFEPATLENIAIELTLTRERVRQILKKIVEKIKDSPSGKKLAFMISSLDSDILWEKLSGNKSIIHKNDINRAFEKRMPGEFVLALECCEMSIESMLSMVFCESKNVWYKSSKIHHDLDIPTKKFCELIQQTSLPLPLATVIHNLDVTESVANVVIYNLEFRIYDGYVFQGRIGARARRTAHLHGILNVEATIISLQDIIILHNKKYPIESCSTRDADLVMREAPHLFVLLGDKGWCSIGNYRFKKSDDTGDKEILNDFELKSDQGSVNDDATVTSILISILKNRGISNFVDIINEFKKITRNDYSEYSVAPMLYIRDEFIKLAPSIYGLRENFYSFSDITSDLLLNDYDVQLFIMARYAGEEFCSFPLWNSSMEYKWYLWIEKHQNIELTESFYFIATPDEWPISKEKLIDIKYKINDQLRAYCFLREPIYYESNLPDIRNIYSLIRYIKENKSINWISANRVLGRKINNYHTFIDIAFLVCFGIIEPAENWQKNHYAIQDEEGIEEKLSFFLHCGQGDSWKSPTGDFLIDLFTLNVNSSDMGWVDTSALNKLFHASSKETVNSIKTENLSSEKKLTEVNCIDENVGSQGKYSSSKAEDNVGELFLLLDDDDTIILN